MLVIRNKGSMLFQIYIRFGVIFYLMDISYCYIILLIIIIGVTAITMKPLYFHLYQLFPSSLTILAVPFFFINNSISSSITMIALFLSWFRNNFTTNNQSSATIRACSTLNLLHMTIQNISIYTLVCKEHKPQSYHKKSLQKLSHSK